MPSRSLVDAVFFDFDGVIVDSVALKREAFRSVLVECAGDRIETCMNYFMQNGGISRLTKFNHVWTVILGHPADQVATNRLAKEFADRVFTLTCQSKFIRGAKEFLESYAQEVPCYVISGTPEEELRNIIRTRGMESYFHGVFGSPPTKVEIGNEIIRQTGYGQMNVWFVGDATTDRDAARELGVNFVGVDGPHLRPYLDGSETMIKDLTELAEVVFGQPVTP